MSLATISLGLQLSVVGILESLCCIYLVTLVCASRFRTAVNILIANFCISCAYMILCRGFVDAYGVYYPTLSDQITSYCVFREYVPLMNNCFTIYPIVMITINRYLLIQYPLTELFKKRRWALFSSFAAWFISFLMCIPQLVVAIQVGQLVRLT